HPLQNDSPAERAGGVDREEFWWVSRITDGPEPSRVGHTRGRATGLRQATIGQVAAQCDALRCNRAPGMRASRLCPECEGEHRQRGNAPPDGQVAEVHDVRLPRWSVQT